MDMDRGASRCGLHLEVPGHMGAVEASGESPGDEGGDSGW